MNKSLIRKLTKKWSQPGGLPGKGYELVRDEQGLNPCAQSEAIMASKGMGVMDFQAFWRGSVSRIGHSNELDKVTAEVLGISIIHSILLRRFNDLSSQSPAMVLNETERVLGKNWKKVLEFWHFMESLTPDDFTNLLNTTPLASVRRKDTGKANKEDTLAIDEWNLRKAELKSLAETLDVITPDLYYLPGVSSEPIQSSKVNKKTVEEVKEIYPNFKGIVSSNQHKPQYLPDSRNSGDESLVVVVGDYTRAYFGWVAPFDYFLSEPSIPGDPKQISLLQVLFSCATNEIQTLRNKESFEDLYFCKILGYNPLKNYTLKRLSRRLQTYKRSFSKSLTRFHRITDNLLYARFSSDPEVRRETTKGMVEGILVLTKEDILSLKAHAKVVETYEAGKGRFFGTLELEVPKLGPDRNLDAKFHELIQWLREDYHVQPLSYCPLEGDAPGEGSRWAVRGKVENLNYRFNAPERPLRKS